MAIQRTNAIVLKRFPVRETSLVAVFFSQDFGKFSGILKGIRKKPKKFNSPVDLCSINQIVFYPSRNSSLHLVSQCDLIEHPLFSANKDVYWLAGYLMRLVEVVTVAQQPNKRLYDMLVTSLNLISKVEKMNFLRIFEIKLLDLVGFKPYIDGCVSCLRRDFQKGVFSAKEGGLLCEDCAYKDISAEKVCSGLIKAMRAIEQMSFDRALRVHLGKTLDKRLTTLVHQFLEYHLGRKIRPVSPKDLVK